MRPRNPYQGSRGSGEPVHPLEPVVSSLDDGLLVLDDQGVIRFANPAAGRLFGHEPEALVGGEFGHPVTKGLISEIDVVGGRPEPGVAQMRITSTRWRGAPAYVAALRDVTEYKARVDELEDALTERTAAVASASHELQNPLTAVRLAARLLNDHWADLADEDRTRHFATILRNARRIGLLMRNMLLRSRFEAGVLHPDLEDVNVAECILHVVNDLEEQAVDLEVNAEDGCVARVDREHLTQSLINLVTNALKYGAAPVVMTARCEGDHVTVTVRDHGPGVPDDFVPHLFERFSRAESTRVEQHGTGLGLSIVRIVTAANGGAITYAHPDDGHGGAAFTLRFPRAS